LQWLGRACKRHSASRHQAPHLRWHLPIRH
jgi:hypothetical protein